MSTLRDWAAFFVDVSQLAVTVMTAADSVTPDASLTSILFTIDEHRCGVTGRYTCDDSRGILEKIEVLK